MDSVEDTLTKEMNKLLLGTAGAASAAGGGGSSTSAHSHGLYPNIRPITTGVLDFKNKYYGIRKNIDSYVDTPSSTSSNGQNMDSNNRKHRPRAPLLSRYPHGEAGEGGSGGTGTQQGKEQGKPKRGDRNKSKQTKRNKKSKSIDVLWESLQHFSKNNLGRSLVDSDVTTMINSPADGVHFVNLSHEDDLEDSYTPTKLSIDGNSRIFSIPREPIEVANFAGHLTSLPSTKFTIPELPSGNLLTINILSTWGDPHYVGLMGLEIFDKSGHVVRLSNIENQIWANPADINILSEYDSDPRTVDNLLDGVNHTCDDLHAWLAPYTRGQDHFIYIEFDERTTISMIRIWNYNKNRIHSYRGARYIEMYLEDQHTKKGGTPSTSVIFRGEIKRAPGGVFESYEDCCECILFTTNPVILSLIEKYDPLESQQSDTKGASVPSFLQRESNKSSTNIQSLEPSSNYMQTEREQTSVKKFSPSLLLSPSPSYQQIQTTQVSATKLSGGIDDFGGWDPGNLNRPTTGKRNQVRKASNNDNFTSESILEPQGSEIDSPPLFNSARKSIQPVRDEDVLSISFDSLPSHLVQSSTAPRSLSKTVSFKSPVQKFLSSNSHGPYIRPSTALASRQHEPIRVSAMIINVLSNWGDSNRVGLSGVSALDDNFGEVSLPIPTLFYGSSGNSKLTPHTNSQLSTLVKGNHLTTNPSNMWSVPCDSLYGGAITLRFDLPNPLLLRGLRIWNYNGENEDTCVGTRHVDIFLEQKRNSQNSAMYDGLTSGAVQVASRLVLRKAPGEADLEYAQFVHLNCQDQNSSAEPRSLRSQRNNSTSDLNREFGEDMRSSPLTIPPKMIPLVVSSDHDDDPQPLSPDSSALNESGTCLVNQQYETPINPCGSMLKFVFLSSQGDPYYIGLNGIEIYDECGHIIELSEDQLQAAPYRDVNDLPEIRERGYDARCLQNLIHPENNTFNDMYMWLSPLSTSSSHSNTVYIMFDEPMKISFIKLWNYSKSPARGVKEIEVFLDDVLVYKGNMRPSPTKEMSESNDIDELDMWWVRSEQLIVNGAERRNLELDLSQTILFTNDPTIIAAEECRVPFFDDGIDFIDEGKHILIETPSLPSTKLTRPMTTVVGRRGK